MNASARPSRATTAYPGKVAIRHAVEAAKACGIDVAGIKVSPDGTIELVEARAVRTPGESLFEQWKDQL